MKDSEPLKQTGSQNISHVPKFSTCPLPCRLKTLHPLTQRMLPRLVNTPLNCTVVESGKSHSAPASTTTLLLKLTVPPRVSRMPPFFTSTKPVKLELEAFRVALLATTTALAITVPLIERLLRMV